MLWRVVISCLVVTIVFALWAAASLMGTTDVATMHVSSIDWRSSNLVLVHLNWWRRSWIESALQLLQQAMMNVFGVSSLAFSCDYCVYFAGSSLAFGCGGCGDDAYFLALIGGLGIPYCFI